MPATATDRLQGLTTSLAVKAPCKVAAASNITLSGEQTIGGVAVVTGDRVLTPNQTDATKRLLWVADTGPWTMAADFDGPRDVTKGTMVLAGTSTPGSWQFWLVDAAASPIVPGTTSLTWEQVDYAELALRSDLASTALASKNAGMVGFDFDLNYVTGTLGGAVNAGMPSFWWALNDAEIADWKAGTHSIDIAAKLQACLDALPEWYAPPGGPLVAAALEFNDGNMIVGAGMRTCFYLGYDGPFIVGKDVTPAAGTNVRRYNCGGRDFMVYGPGVASTNSIGLDQRGITWSMWQNILLQNIHTGVRRGDGYSTYYNACVNVAVSTCVSGFYTTGLGNSNPVFGGRVNESTTGTFDEDCSHNTYYGVAVEQFQTVAHKTGSGGATIGIAYHQSRIENGGALLNTGTCFDIATNSQDTLCSAMYARGYGKLITKASKSELTGIRTHSQLSECHTLSGGSPLQAIWRHEFTIDPPNLAAGASADIAVTISGALATDQALWTPPDTLTAGLMFDFVAGSSQHYLRLTNTTAGAINEGSKTWVLTIFRFDLTPP